MNLFPILDKLIPKTKDIFNFYSQLYQGEWNKILDDTLDQLSNKYGIDKSDLKPFLENFNKEKSGQQEIEVFNDFYILLYKNIYKKPELQAELIARIARSTELNFEEIKDLISSLKPTESKRTKMSIDYGLYTKRIFKEISDETKKSIGYYIPIYLDEQAINSHISAKDDEKNESILPEQVWLNHDHVVILGDPGSGKSCLLNQLAIDIIDKSHLVPLVIEAKFWGFSYSTIPKAIKYILKPYFNNINEITIIDDLDTNKYVILIDGYDEIRKAKVLFESEIMSLAKIKGAKIILTSRESNYHGQLPNFEIFKIKELNNAQIDDYASNVISSKFFSHHLSDLNLLELARLPLYLFMLCERAKDNKNLPKNKAALHQEFASKLLEDKLFKRIPAYQPRFDLQSKLRFLSKLAEKKTIDPLYNDYIKCLKEMEIVNNANDFMQEILESGILKGNLSFFDFIHPTVREFFYALLISSYESTKIIVFLTDYHTKDEFLDIILFLVGLPKKQEKQRDILDFLERNDLPLYIKCLKVRYVIFENTNNYSEFECKFLFQLQSSYNILLEKFFDHIKFQFYPYSTTPLNQSDLGETVNVQLVGYIDVPNLKVNYGYKLTNITNNLKPLIISKKSFISKFEDGTPFYMETCISGLDLDFAREMAIEDVRRELRSIIDERRLIHPVNITCEMLVANIKKIASSARTYVDKSLELLWKFESGIYDAREYYEAFNIIKGHPYISWGTAPKRCFNVGDILTILECIMKNSISLKEQVLPPCPLHSPYPNSREEMEKLLVLRIGLMYSILPELYMELIKSNFPELQKYMRYVNIYPFKCIVRYHYGIDLMKKGLIIDPLGDAAVYFKPIPYGEELTASVERGNPEFSREEISKLRIEYMNDLKSVGRYCRNEYFHLFIAHMSDIINNLSLSNTLYELINEDLEWLLEDDYVQSNNILVVG